MDRMQQILEQSLRRATDPLHVPEPPKWYSGMVGVASDADDPTLLPSHFYRDVDTPAGAPGLRYGDTMPGVSSVMALEDAAKAQASGDRLGTLLGLLGISMPVGGPRVIGLLGRAMPKVPERSIFEAMDDIGYKLGSSANQVYTHADVEPERGRQFLTKAERALVNQVEDKALRSSLAEQIGTYRAEHSTSKGWNPLELLGSTISETEKELKDGTKKLVRTIAPKFKMQSPEFHINPHTGKPYTPGDERSDYIEDLSNKLVSEVQEVLDRAGKGDKNASFVLDQARWYKDAQKTIQEIFGDDAGLYADIEGSLSPNTRLSQQHANADDLYRRYKAGVFDDAIARFDAHMQRKPPNETASSWARHLNDSESPYYDPKAMLRKAEIDPATGMGKLYGMNSSNAMLALRGLFRQTHAKQAPKMRNFAGNLRGDSVRPTIDIWAGRTINRLAGRPRVPPKVDKGVPGGIAADAPMFTQGDRLAMARAAEQQAAGKEPRITKALEKARGRVPNPDITGQYGIASDAFESAAAKLGMDAADLQALMWFREKELWESKGWTPVDEAPSLVELIKRDNGR